MKLKMHSSPRGSIEKTRSGKYRVRYYDGAKSEAGKAILRRSGMVNTRIEAERLRLVISKDIDRQREIFQAVTAGRVLSMDTILYRWGESRFSSGHARVGRIYEVKSTLIPILEEMNWNSPLLITADAVDRWIVMRRESGRSDNPLRYLKAVLRWAAGPPLRQPIDLGVLKLTPSRRPYSSKPKLLTDEQLSACLKLAEQKGGRHVALAYRHLATYGCRPKDLCGVRLRDFNYKEMQITYTKTKNGRQVTHPLRKEDSEAYEKLCLGREQDDFLFTNPWRDPWLLGKREQAYMITSWWRDNVTRCLQFPTKQCGIYCLKDYAITQMEIQGIEDQTKALFTGHETLGVFARYKTTNEDRAKKALALMNKKTV
jgi:integrase